VTRIGPNDLHFWNAEAITPIYKAGKAMGKTEFYDAFTTFNPNLFGTRNEAVGLESPTTAKIPADLFPSAESLFTPAPARPRFLASFGGENGTYY
jgi:hypothetical protein